MKVMGDAPAVTEQVIVVEYRDELIYLLREAAELEHTILCGYLFAAFSLKQRLDEGLTAAQLEAVEGWRGTILTVAKQEMLHLTLVQNLLTAIGGAPHLSRPNLPAPAKYFPAGVHIALEPFGERALRHFLYLERPEGVVLEDPDARAAVERARPMMASDDIVPAAQEYATVGHLYRAIEAGFAHLAGTLGTDRLFVGPTLAQASAELMKWDGLVSVTDLASARAAIDTIIEQGEGATGHWRAAHFGRFHDMYDEFLAMRTADPSFEPARPVRVGSARAHRDGVKMPHIDDPVTRQVADLFNVANEIMLLALTRFFAHTDETPDQLRTLESVGIGLMFGAIEPLGQLLTTLPFGPSAPGRTAGPTFELFYVGGYLLPHRAAAWTLISERLRQAEALAKRIESEGQDLGKIPATLERYAAKLDSSA